MNFTGIAGRIKVSLPSLHGLARFLYLYQLVAQRYFLQQIFS